MRALFVLRLAVPAAPLMPRILTLLRLLVFVVRAPSDILIRLLMVVSALVVPLLASVLLAAGCGGIDVGRWGLEARVRHVAGLEQLFAGPAYAPGAPEATPQADERYPGPEEYDDDDEAWDH